MRKLLTTRIIIYNANAVNKINIVRIASTITREKLDTCDGAVNPDDSADIVIVGGDNRNVIVNDFVFYPFDRTESSQASIEIRRNTSDILYQLSEGDMKNLNEFCLAIQNIGGFFYLGRDAYKVKIVPSDKMPSPHDKRFKELLQKSRISTEDIRKNWTDIYYRYKVTNSMDFSHIVHQNCHMLKIFVLAAGGKTIDNLKKQMDERNRELAQTRYQQHNALFKGCDEDLTEKHYYELQWLHYWHQMYKYYEYYYNIAQRCDPYYDSKDQSEYPAVTQNNTNICQDAYLPPRHYANAYIENAYQAYGPDAYQAYGPDAYQAYGPDAYQAYGPDAYQAYGPDAYQAYHLKIYPEYMNYNEYSDSRRSDHSDSRRSDHSDIHRSDHSDSRIRDSKTHDSYSRDRERDKRNHLTYGSSRRHENRYSPYPPSRNFRK
jgi:hypothetical protein